MSVPWSVPGYRMLRELGTGASGTVVHAQYEGTGADVAIKYLAPELAGDESFLRDFRSEARLLQEIDDPNVARLYEYVQSGASAAIVLELVDGVSLAEMLAHTGPLTPEAALVVLKGSLTGLAAAHARGVVHRDMKPGNVVVSGTGTTKLIDFGVAVRVGRAVPVAGTPDYMAPEQWRGEAVSPAADVYAATAVFVEAVSGRRAYEATSMDALRRQHLNAPPPVELVPSGLQRLVRDGMAKDVEVRTSDARALLTALEKAAGSAYGADWEQSGRRSLSRRAMLLASLFPRAGMTAAGAPAFARTFLGQRALAVVAIAGVLLGTVVVDRARRDPGRSTSAQFDTSATASLTPTVTVTPSASASPSPTRTRAATRSATPTSSEGVPTVTVTATPTRSQPATRTRTSAQPPPPPPPPPANKVTITKLSLTQLTPDKAEAYAAVTVTQPDEVKIVLTYSDGTASAEVHSGGGTYIFTETHFFTSCPGAWSATATTVPAAANEPFTAEVKC